MKERPILFSRSMVQAIREGRKTMTRRLVRAQPDRIVGDLLGQPKWYLDGDPSAVICCPYGVPGDRLWVRETCILPVFNDDPTMVVYAADHADPEAARAEVQEGADGDVRWRSSIHMPRWASRIDLEVTSVRVERLRDITDEDVIAEGVTVYPFMKGYHADGLCRTAAQECFRQLWADINDERAPWRSDPWVWVVSFRRLP